MGGGAQGGRFLACSSSLFPDVTQVCVFCEKSCSSLIRYRLIICIIFSNIFKLLNHLPTPNDVKD